MQIKFFKKEKSFKKGREGLWLNMNFYWKLSVGFMFIVFFVSLFFGYYFFMKINEEPASSVNVDSGQAQTIKKERIDKVLEYFSKRAQKSSQILNSPSPVIDPSL